MKRTTTITIRVGSKRVTWKVPRGFGAAYKRETAHQLEILGKGNPGELIDGLVYIMLLIGYAPTREAVADWDLRKRVECAVWAATEALRASDNPSQRHPPLPWLEDVKPWCGPPAERPAHIRSDLWGAFDGPTPTVIS